jgi:hypothetical protein
MWYLLSQIISIIQKNQNLGGTKGRRKTKHMEEGEQSFCYIKVKFFSFSSLLYPHVLLIHYWAVSPIVGPGAT